MLFLYAVLIIHPTLVNFGTIAIGTPGMIYLIVPLIYDRRRASSLSLCLSLPSYSSYMVGESAFIIFLHYFALSSSRLCILVSNIAFPFVLQHHYSASCSIILYYYVFHTITDIRNWAWPGFFSFRKTIELLNIVKSWMIFVYAFSVNDLYNGSTNWDGFFSDLLK